jgi:hypothetical protein
MFVDIGQWITPLPIALAQVCAQVEKLDFSKAPST